MLWTIEDYKLCCQNNLIWNCLLQSSWSSELLLMEKSSKYAPNVNESFRTKIIPAFHKIESKIFFQLADTLTPFLFFFFIIFFRCGCGTLLESMSHPTVSPAKSRRRHRCWIKRQKDTPGAPINKLALQQIGSILYAGTEGIFDPSSTSNIFDLKRNTMWPKFLSETCCHMHLMHTYTQ